MRNTTTCPFLDTSIIKPIEDPVIAAKAFVMMPPKFVEPEPLETLQKTNDGHNIIIICINSGYIIFT